MMKKMTLIFLLPFLVTNALAGPKPLDGEILLEQVKKRVNNINTEQLQQQLKDHPQTIVIDVRNPDEIRSFGGTIDTPLSRNIPRGWLEHRVPEAVSDLERPIVVFCGTNQRSPFAAETLMKQGYKNVFNYVDGFFAWRDAGLPVETGDKAPDSILYSKPQQVSKNVWSAIGATAPPTYENSGHNNNLSFVIGDDAVLVVNAGDNYLLAKALHDEIKKITDLPVKYVVLENGQGHAMLGSGYWKEQGATIIAHEEAAQVIRDHGDAVLESMQKGRRDKSMSTTVVLPDETFTDKKAIKLGSVNIELLYLGLAHSPGDIQVWLPQQKLIIAGDLAFHQRLLTIFDYTDTANWVETWGRLEALDPEVVIPGHGGPTNMQEVTRYTHGYLTYMREKIGLLIEDGATLEEAYKVDQSAYAHLDTFEELARSNAGRIFRAMEFE